MVKKAKQHYVNNKEFLAAMIEFKQNVAEAEEKGKPRPLVSHYIGECLMKIAVHLSHKPNFVNYTFKDDMISDGIENCLQYIDNFNPEKSKNPFAYFTQIIYYAFLRRIAKEKKVIYTRLKFTDEVNLQNINEYGTPSNKGEWSRDHIDSFIEDFEETKRRKKNKNTTAIDVLMNGE